MAIIKKIYGFNKHKIKNMISFLENDEAEKFAKRFINSSCDMFHYWLPLNMKFQEESYVLIDENDLLGMISIIPARGNYLKINITKLLFKKNYYDIGKQLVEFILARYGAKGAQTFNVVIDESHDELARLFVEGCGFRKCASEILWRINDNEFTMQKSAFRSFKNTDAKIVAELFNDSLITHFKPSLLKDKNEFADSLFKGLIDNTEFKYITDSQNSKDIPVYFSIKTYDNHNYIMDIISSNGCNVDYNYVLNFAKSEISKRHKKFSLFVKSSQYKTNAKELDTFLENNNCNCVQKQIVFVKDFYRLQKQDLAASKMVLFSESERPVFKTKIE